MKKTLFKTGDGSYTLHIPEWGEQYHSKHGAIAEARHVFLKEGLYHYLQTNPQVDISILEIGFGTGLNALLTYLETDNISVRVNYTGVEAYPLNIEEVEKLNYSALLDIPNEKFLQLHSCPWEERVAVSSKFQLTKEQKRFSEISTKNSFNLIYFDAFGIRVQPELWTEAIFKIMYNALQTDGYLVTYAANGNARRAMQAVGFTVERLPGPPGKKEMLRAKKI